MQTGDQLQASQIENHVLKRFNILKKVGSGAYGHVWKVEDKNNKKVYALKKIFDAFQHSTDAQRTYREIQILKQTEHPNIIKLFDTIRAENNKDVYLVFEFMEADLHNVIAEGILKEVHIRFIVYQLAKSLKYLHTGSIIHRDLKPSNILVNSNCTIKLCDFGLVRSLLAASENGPVLTEGVATRWYRAPEVLLGSKSYSTPADIWSFGCIIYEILAQKPMFPGNSTVDQIDRIITYNGYPTEEDIKGLQSEVAKTMLKQTKISHSSPQYKSMLKDFPPMFSDLLQKMTAFNPKKRITIQEILAHEVVKPFRKKQEEINCEKQIRTSIDDNLKLPVEEYRSFVYGSRRANTPTSSENQYKLTKKSNSYSKFPSNSTQVEKEQKPEKQALTYVRSAKDVIKSMHAYNRSIQLAGSNDNSSKIKTESNNQRLSLKDPTKMTYISQNFYSPKYGQPRLLHNPMQPGNTNTNFNYPKSNTHQREPKPLYKASKYVINKTEHIGAKYE